MPTDAVRPARVPPLWPLLALCAAAAAWMALAAAACEHNGNTLVPVLVSLQRWTFFYWEQDCIGMLPPLLALPLRDPFVNLLAQQALCYFGGLAALVLLARCALRDATYPAAAVVSAAAFVALASPWWRQVYFIHPYCSLWIALGLGAVVAAEFPHGAAPSRRRRLAALALSAAAHWVYSATALLLAPLVLCRAALGRGAPPDAAPERTWRGQARRWLWHGETGFTLLALAGGMALGLAAMKLARASRTETGALPAGEWAGSALRFCANAWHALEPQRWTAFLAGCGALGLLLLAAPGWRRRAAPAWRAAAALAAAALPYGLFMASRKWPAMNGHNVRYVFPCVTLVAAALVIVAAAPPAAALGRRARGLAVPGAAALLLGAAWVGYGPPAPGAARAHLDRTLGALTKDMVEARCTHVAGNYWTVWPAVYHANLVLRERGESRTVWGVSDRGWATRRQALKVPAERVRVAVPPGDTEADNFLRVMGFPPLELVEKRPTVWVYRPAGQSSGSAPN